jgi:hypothetical protein
MSLEESLFDKVIVYFENEFASVKKELEAGFLDDYRERVLTSQKIAHALNLLSPYARNEWRARKLVKDGEALKNELLSARDIVTRPSF